MKTKLAMVIDSSTCIDCKGCMAACKVENKVPAGHWRNWIKRQEANFITMEKTAGKTAGHFQPGNCMHCDTPTCVQACPTGATYKDEKDGTVKVNDELCIGCGSCMPACPYGARYRHPEKKIVDKCDYCDARRHAGKTPACVETCPTQARTFGNLNNSDSRVAKLVPATLLMNTSSTWRGSRVVKTCRPLLRIRSCETWPVRRISPLSRMPHLIREFPTSSRRAVTNPFPEYPPPARYLT